MDCQTHSSDLNIVGKLRNAQCQLLHIKINQTLSRNYEEWSLIMENDIDDIHSVTQYSQACTAATGHVILGRDYQFSGFLWN